MALSFGRSVQRCFLLALLSAPCSSHLFLRLARTHFSSLSINTAPLGQKVRTEHVPSDLYHPSCAAHPPAMYAECDGLVSAGFGSGYKQTVGSSLVISPGGRIQQRIVQLVRVEGGTNACVYRFAPGWPLKDTGLIGKTLQSRGTFGEGPGSEVDTLKQVSLRPQLSLFPKIPR